MKTVFAICALLITSSALATSLITQRSEVLPLVKIDGKKTNYTGVIVLDFVENKMSLSIYNDSCHHYTAKPGEPTCAAMPALVKSLVVPLDTRKVSCGSAYFNGTVDQTPIDGALTKIQFTDNTRRVCEDVVPFIMGAHATVTRPMVGKTTVYEAQRKTKSL